MNHHQNPNLNDLTVPAELILSVREACLNIIADLEDLINSQDPSLVKTFDAMQESLEHIRAQNLDECMFRDPMLRSRTTAASGLKRQMSKRNSEENINTMDVGYTLEEEGSGETSGVALKEPADL